MTDPQEYINSKVKSGNDIIFGESHDVIGSTFDMMAATILSNQAAVSAVSLEFPVEVQSLLDRVQSGTIEKEPFIREMRITMEQSYLDTAYDLLNKDYISEEQYSDYAAFIDGKIDGVLHGGNEFYTEEHMAVDEIALGSLYNLSQTAGTANIPIYATDLDREYVILSDLGIETSEDWISRLDDTSDFKLLSQQVDINSPGVILAHRGAAHTQNQNGIDNGLDDYLERAGRQVTVLGNYGSIESMSDLFNHFADSGISIEQGSDFTIVNGNGYEQPDIFIANNYSVGAFTP